MSTALSYSARMNAQRAARRAGATVTTLQPKQAAPIVAAPTPAAPIIAAPTSAHVPQATPALDFDALAIFHTNEMQRLAAVSKAKDILWSFAPSLLSAEDRWRRLPAETRRILTNAETAGVGQFVPTSP